MRKRPSLRDVLDHRAQLVARAQVQRQTIAGDLQVLRGLTAWVDRGIEAGTYLRAHPVVLVGASVVILVVFRRPLLGGGWMRVIRRGFVAWRALLALRGVAVRLAR
jgi:hypothetical protein